MARKKKTDEQVEIVADFTVTGSKTKEDLMNANREKAVAALAKLKAIEAEKIRKGELETLKVGSCTVSATPERMKDFRKKFKIYDN